jgi:peptidyl-prolyl cis-trans isomerase A (cyclophilin A)
MGSHPPAPATLMHLRHSCLQAGFTFLQERFMLSFQPFTPFISRRQTALTLAGALLTAPAWAQAEPQVLLKTSMGDITVALNEAKAPRTVANFLQYVHDKHYDGTVFHRVIDGFMIQGGGMDAAMKEKPTRAPIALEAGNGLKNDRGTIAMARTGAPNSATSQFFINVVNNDMLNAPKPDGYGYAVFGKVVKGMDVVDKIRTVATGNRGMHQNVPTTPVTILSATEIR